MSDNRSEVEIKTQIRLRLGKVCCLWLQPTGHGKTESGSEITFGLCRGASDIIGIRKSDGKFVAIEVKTIEGLKRHERDLALARAKHARGERVSTAQRRALEQWLFMRLVQDSGGLAGFASSEDDAERIVVT
jgi:hypothetical protein